MEIGLLARRRASTSILPSIAVPMSEDSRRSSIYRHIVLLIVPGLIIYVPAVVACRRDLRTMTFGAMTDRCDRYRAMNVRSGTLEPMPPEGGAHA
jgi:hypothetical protein